MRVGEYALVFIVSSILKSLEPQPCHEGRAVGRNHFIAPLRSKPPRLDWPCRFTTMVELHVGGELGHANGAIKRLRPTRAAPWGVLEIENLSGRRDLPVT